MTPQKIWLIMAFVLIEVLFISVFINTTTTHEAKLKVYDQKIELVIASDNTTAKELEILNSEVKNVKRRYHNQLIMLLILQIVVITLFVFLVQSLNEQEKAVISARRAAKKLLDALAKHERLFFIISQEIRSPIVSIQMQLDSINADRDHPVISVIKEKISALITVIDDLQVVINPEHVNHFKYTTTSPYQVLSELVSSLKPMAHHHDIKLSFFGDEYSKCLCVFDKPTLRQIVSTLIKNAITHSKGNMIVVSIDSVVTDDNILHCQVSVQDNGVGISLYKIPELFDPLLQQDIDIENVGLGLHIIKEIASRLNGTIEYAAEPGTSGAKFVVTAELDKIAEGPGEVMLNELALSNGLVDILVDKHVMVVEDNPTMLMLIRTMLEKQGAVVDVASDGIEALSFLSDDTDILITDIIMPEMNGIDLAKELRKSGFDKPIIGLTAAVSGDELEELLACGADAVLGKPLNILELKQCIASILYNKTINSKD